MNINQKIQDMASFFGYDIQSTYSDGKKNIVILSLLCIVIITAFITLRLGTYSISIDTIATVIIAHMNIGDINQIPKLQNTIIWDIRLPRVILSVMVGGALAISGAVYQSVFRNPLVEPYILGVSSGAAFGAALGIVFHSIFFSIQIFAFLFAVIAVVCSYSMARVRGQTPLVTLVLSGVIVAAIFSALVSFMNYIANDSQLREIIFWLMGGFYYASWPDVHLFVPIVIICFIILWALAWRLNILSMGDDEARTLGVNPEKNKIILISLSTAITALAVSLVGIVAWVGLMMPHAARMILGPDNRYVIPCCFLMGGFYLLICDTLARTITMNEIPIGIITSLLGAPYLVYLIRSKGSSFVG